MPAESYPADLAYHAAHDWARVDGDSATFGITWYAQDSLGDVVVYLPPEVGQHVTAGKTYAELESVKAVSEIVAPLSGEILAVNDAVVSTPELVNDDPYGAGWLIRIRLSDPAEQGDLLDDSRRTRQRSRDRVVGRMRARRTLTVVGCHAGGEVGDVITGGVLPPAGATVFEQMQTLQRDGDSLRRLLLREPRGSVARHVQPDRARDAPRLRRGLHHHGADRVPADVGLEHDLHHDGAARDGHGRDARARDGVRLEAPGGVVEVRARCANGRCESVEFTNVPCFAHRLDAPLEVEGIGTIAVDVAYGGMWYAIADAGALGFAIEPHEARDLSVAGERIRAAAREQLECVHPENPAIAGVSIVSIAEPWQGVGNVTRNAVVVAPGRLDRSATGTGLSARLAVLHARGQLRVGDAMSHASAIGSTFDGRIVSEARVGDRPGIVPAIRGSAWITGIAQIYVDDTDPYPEGYLLSDTWGVSGLDEQV